MKKTEETQSTALVIETLPPIQFDITAQALAKLKKQSAAFKEVPATTADYQALTKQLALVRTTRTSIEARRVEANAPVLEWQRQLNAKAKELTQALQEIETPLVNLKMQADTIKAQEKAAKEAAERARLEALQEKIRAITNSHWYAETPEAVTQAIADLDAMEISPGTFEELAAVADVAREETMMKLRQKLAKLEADRIAEENRQQELAAMETKRQAQAEIDRQQREQQAALDAQRAAIEAETRALREAQAQVQREAEAKAQAEAAEAARVAREAQEKAAQEALAKAAAAQVKKQKAWKKAILFDLPAIDEWLGKLGELVAPETQTSEAKTLVADVERAINEAMMQAHILREAGESHE